HRPAEAAGHPLAGLAALCAARPRFVAWKRGAGGGALFDARERRLHQWPARAGRVEDPTGAGDAFMSGFVTAQLERDDVERSLRPAVVTASLAIEAAGADGLLRATRADAEARLAAWDRAAELRR